MPDWIGPPGGLPHTALRGPKLGEARDELKADTAAPEVGFGAKAERINPSNRELRFIVPLTDGPVYLGDVELAVSPKDELSIEAPRLLELLKPVVEQKTFAELSAAVASNGRLDQAALGQHGIRLRYDSRNLALAIEIPTGGRQSRSYSMRRSSDSRQETLKPASFAFYLNFHAQMEFVEAGGTKGIIPPVASIDAAVRFRGLVAENEGYLSSRGDEPVFRRTGSRLSYDDTVRSMRWTFGDLQIYSRPFQATPTVMGLGVTRVYSQIDPQREIRAGGAQSFSVLSPSMIETFVNGRSVERRSFQPGNYTLSDFPLAEGANAVKLRIEDSSGKVRMVDFSVYANQSLLAKGVTEFSAFAGVYSTPTRTGFSYSRDWIASGFVRAGLSEQVTAGANFQANKRVRNLGAEVLWGSPIGLAGFSLTASDASGRGKGLAAAITFERLLSYRGGARSQSFRASIEWRSKRFAIPEVAFGQDRTELRASAGYVVTLGDNAFVAADAQYSRDRFTRLKSYGARLSGGFDVTTRLAATGELGYNRGSPRNETYFRIGLRMRVGERATFQVDADSTGRARASYSNSGGNGNGAWQTSADLSHDKDAVSLNANASLATNRAEFGLQQTAGWMKHGMKLQDARLSVRAAFAIAFADGVVAVGRPVSEAFVVAKPHKSLAGKRVYLDPVDHSETARSDGLGPALDGQLGAYSERTLVYQVPDAPSGYDLGAGNISIRPPYKAGYKLVIGSDYHLLVVGTLLDREGEPVRLLAGKALDLGDPKHPAITVFTSRNGKFGAQGLRPGRWRIEMPAARPLAYEFEVTDSPDGIARIGELRPIRFTGERQ